MAKSRNVFAIVMLAIVVLISLLVAVVQLSPFVFGKLLVDAGFQDCMTLEGIGTLKSKDEIFIVADSCAKKEGVYVDKVTIQSLTPNKVTVTAMVVIDYSVPIAAAFKLHRSIERKFFIHK